MAKVLLVTGGSRGIGAEISRRGAELGYAVAINYASSAGDAEKVANQIEELGDRVLPVQADVSDPDAVRAMYERIDNDLGPVTHLVNNAGIMGSIGRIEDLDEAKIHNIFAVNVLGPFYCAKYAIKRMAKRYGGDGGAIVNISSAAKIHGGPGAYVDYAATKGAIEAFTVGLAREQALEGIRVNCVRPGFTLTEMNERYMEDDPGWAEATLPKIPMARAADVKEMANATLYLLSDQASYSTGAVLDVTGGWTCP